ncbi:MAG: hypothetical protein JKY20_06595 [Alphaproteobacteria bacterium]|nr:hypothetical protein [Alphaproteobacteria bacterium]
MAGGEICAPRAVEYILSTAGFMNGESERKYRRLNHVAKPDAVKRGHNTIPELRRKAPHPHIGALCLQN